MTNKRSVHGIFQGAPTHMVGDGFRVSNYFPSGNAFSQRFSPFLLLDYNEPFSFPPTESGRGVGAHPHRGFETVTIAYEGFVEHHDNTGNHGIIGPGDVQWMTAGSGLLHKEYHEREFAKKGGVFHMIQLWVNLPRAHKSTAPAYQELSKAKMGYVDLPDQSGKVRIIAGDYEGTQGPASTFTPIHLFDISFSRMSGTANFRLPSHFNTGLLVLRGSVKVNGEHVVENGKFVLFDNVEGDIHLQSLTDDALVIVLSGEPIDEPVVMYGPFVMTSKEEIAQAYEDFRAGKMGSIDF